MTYLACLSPKTELSIIGSLTRSSIGTYSRFVNLTHTKPTIPNKTHPQTTQRQTQQRERKRHVLQLPAPVAILKRQGIRRHLRYVRQRVGIFTPRPTSGQVQINQVVCLAFARAFIVQKKQRRGFDGPHHAAAIEETLYVGFVSWKGFVSVFSICAI